MISGASVWAVVLRHARLWRRDPNYLLAGFYWPVLDIVVWGFLGSWIQQAAHFSNYETIALLGILLWQIIGRGCNFIGMAFVEELWSNNIVNLFSLPMRTAEWLLGITVFSAIMIGLVTLICLGVILLLYDVSLGLLVSTFLIFLPPLFIASIWVGFTNLQVMVLLGKRGIELSFVTIWFLAPFSGAYYPIDVLPSWAQTVSAWFPMSYIFQGMRVYMAHGDYTPYLIKGYLLSTLYAICAIMLFLYCFSWSKRRGLARLTD